MFIVCMMPSPFCFHLTRQWQQMAIHVMRVRPLDLQTMGRRRLFLALRAVFVGWSTLLLIAYLLDGALRWTAPIIGDVWLATARLTLDCFALAATGWVAGYWSRPYSFFASVVLAATLTLRDFNPLLPIDVPWLLHLAIDTWRDDRYLESLVTTAAGQALLFGCLIAGAMLGRPRAEAPQIFGK
jgi:hypothetical protein